MQPNQREETTSNSRSSITSTPTASTRLIIFCNPLLDLSLSTTSSFISSLGLVEDGSVLATTSELQSLAHDLLEGKHGEVMLSAGGAGQNTARAVQWLLSKHYYRQEKSNTASPSMVAYAGSIGVDKFGEILAKQACVDGLLTLYQEQSVPPEASSTSSLQTGTCSCLLVDGRRSLVANLSAALHFKPTPEYLSQQIEPVLRSPHCHIVYITGFFLSVSYETIMRLALACKRGILKTGSFSSPNNNNTLNTAASSETPLFTARSPSPASSSPLRTFGQKLFAFNLSAGFVCQDELIDTVLPCVDILFGNADECRVLALAHTFSSNPDHTEGNVNSSGEGGDVSAISSSSTMAIEDIVWWVGKTWRCPLIVITQGADPTLVLFKSKSLKHFPVPPLPSPPGLVDSNGAGDAFVAGFLANLIHHLDNAPLPITDSMNKSSGNNALAINDEDVDLISYIDTHDVERAVQAGHHMASIICGQMGFTLPEEYVPSPPRQRTTSLSASSS